MASASSSLEDRVRHKIDTVKDPCSMAQGLPVGMSEMGLVTDVRLGETDEAGRTDVTLVLRVTAPGCMYVPFMDRTLKTALNSLDEIGEVSTEWEPTADWTPGDIAESARKRITAARDERRRRLLGQTQATR